MDFGNVKAAMTNNLIYKAKVEISKSLEEACVGSEPGTIFATAVRFDKKEQVLLREYGYTIFSLDLAENSIHSELEDDAEGCIATCYRRSK